MTKTMKKLPAILLAVVLAAALSIAVWATTEQSYAATKYFVTVSSEFDLYTALPGGTILLNADVDTSTNNPEDKVGLTYRWEITSGNSYAVLRPNAEDPSIAAVTFRELKDGQNGINEDVGVRCRVFHNDQPVCKDSVTVNVNSDFEALDRTELGTVQIGETVEISTGVRHYTMAHPEGELVDGVTYYWGFYPGEVEITAADGSAVASGEPVSGKGDYFNVKRTSGDSVFFYVTAEWGDDKEDRPSDVAWFLLDPISNNLEDYTVNSGDFIYYLEEGASMSLEELQDIVTVTNGDYVLDSDKYTLIADKYVSYDEKTGESIYEENVPFPLTVDPRDAVSPEGTPTGGTAIYRIRATAAEGSGYIGTTVEPNNGLIWLCSNKTLNYFTPNVSFDTTYMQFVNVYPYIRYEVTPGVALTPKVEINGEQLIEGTDYSVSYVRASDGAVFNEFPPGIGDYNVKVSGIDPYYGEDTTCDVKVGWDNPMSVKAKTVKVKAGKKTTIKTKKAFTVKKAKGKVTYSKLDGNSKISISSKGKVTVKKGLKKGKTYKVLVEVSSPGTDKYLSYSKNVTLKVKVK